MHALGERYLEYSAKYARDMVLVSDETRRVVDCNAATLDALGYTREEILRLGPADLRAPEACAAIERDFEGTRRRGGSTYETVLRRKDGSCFPVEVSQHLIDVGGTFIYHGTFRDITDRKAAAHRIEGLARLYQMLYRTNEAMLHADSKEKLFAGVCQVVESAGMLGAIVRMADALDGPLRAVTFTERLRPLVDHFPVFTSITGADGQAISARAFVENSVIVEQDRLSTVTDSTARALFQAVGLRSAASLPLRCAGKRVGVITFDSSELNFFAPEIVELLEHVAANISYALDNFERERLRRNAEQALRESEERFRGLTEMSTDWYWEQDENFRFTRRTSPLGRAIDVPTSAILGKTRWELGIERGPEERLAAHRQVLEAHLPFRDLEITVVHEGHARIYLSSSGDPVFDANGRFTGYRGVGRNITARKLAESRLVQNAHDLRLAYGKLADTQEQERRAFARELHDQVGHNLTALNLNLSRLKNKTTVGTDLESNQQISDLLALVEDTAQRIRHILSSLRPPMMDDYGLFATLRWWVHENALRSDIAIELTGAEAEPRLPNNVELTLFRVAQEALLNAIKHSGAKHIAVSLQMLPGGVQLAVSDDGRGMVLDSGDHEQRSLLRASWGMLNMRERVEAVGGQLRVSSAPGAGVRVSANVPREQASELP